MEEEYFNPVDTGRKLNVHKTFRRRPGRLLNVLCTFNLRPVFTGKKEADIKGCFIIEVMGVPKTYDFLMLCFHYINYSLKRSCENFRRGEEKVGTVRQRAILSESCSFICLFIYLLYFKGFNANNDGPSVVYNKINIIGNIVKIKPTHDSRSKRIALRVELYGCTLSNKYRPKFKKNT